jgi:hypothetical protein
MIINQCRSFTIISSLESVADLHSSERERIVYSIVVCRKEAHSTPNQIPIIWVTKIPQPNRNSRWCFLDLWDSKILSVTYWIFGSSNIYSIFPSSILLPCVNGIPLRFNGRDLFKSRFVIEANLLWLRVRTTSFLNLSVRILLLNAKN